MANAAIPYLPCRREEKYANQCFHIGSLCLFLAARQGEEKAKDNVCVYMKTLIQYLAICFFWITTVFGPVFSGLRSGAIAKRAWQQIRVAPFTSRGQRPSRASLDLPNYAGELDYIESELWSEQHHRDTRYSKAYQPHCLNTSEGSSCFSNLGHFIKSSSAVAPVLVATKKGSSCEAVGLFAFSDYPKAKGICI